MKEIFLYARINRTENEQNLTVDLWNDFMLVLRRSIIFEVYNSHVNYASRPFSSDTRKFRNTMNCFSLLLKQRKGTKILKQYQNK